MANIDDHIISKKNFPENNRFFCEGVDVWITHDWRLPLP